MSQTAEIHEIETESLPAHVSLCAERYNRLDARISNIEDHLIRIDSALQDIKSAINDDRKAQFQAILTWSGGIITVLLGSTGWLFLQWISR